MSEFHDDTQLHRRDDQSPAGEQQTGIAFDVAISNRWAVGPGANGGYVAGLMARGIIESLSELLPDAEGLIRSMTSHYLRPPSPGPAVLVVQPVRLGRAVSIIDSTLWRDNKMLSTARAVVGPAREGTVEFTDRNAPQFPHPDTIEREAWDNPNFVRARYDTRYVVGRPSDHFSGADTDVAEVAGWIRTGDHTPVDAALAIALTDSWIPAVMVRSGFEDKVLNTLDLTSHLFHSFEPPVDDWIAVRNRTSVSRDGYADIDTELWSTDGVLLGQGRQLGLLLPRPDPATLGG